MAKLSIIIPVYNSESFLKDCIDSILSQSFTDFEILTIDDASADHSLEILNHYMRSDSRVKVFIHDKNKGAPIARNYGIQKATGKYLMFVDSDDELQDNALSILYNNAIIYGSDCIKGTLKYRYKSFKYTWRNKQRPYPLKVTTQAKFKDCRILWHLKEYQTYLFKREIITGHGCLFDENLKACQDIPFLARVLCASNTITILPDNVYLHRNHNRSIVHKQWGYKEYDSLLEGYSLAINQLTRHGYDEAAKDFSISLIDYWYKFIKMPKLLTEQECYHIFDNVRELYKNIKYPIWKENSNKRVISFMQAILNGTDSLALRILRKQSSIINRLSYLSQRIHRMFYFTINSIAIFK